MANHLDALDACQERFLVALERAAAWPDIDTVALALHHIIGGIMVEHANHPRVLAAIKTIKGRHGS